MCFFMLTYAATLWSVCFAGPFLAPTPACAPAAPCQQDHEHARARLEGAKRRIADIRQAIAELKVRACESSRSGCVLDAVKVCDVGAFCENMRRCGCVCVCTTCTRAGRTRSKMSWMAFGGLQVLGCLAAARLMGSGVSIFTAMVKVMKTVVEVVQRAGYRWTQSVCWNK